MACARCNQYAWRGDSLSGYGPACPLCDGVHSNKEVDEVSNSKAPEQWLAFQQGSGVCDSMLSTSMTPSTMVSSAGSPSEVESLMSAQTTGSLTGSGSTSMFGACPVIMEDRSRSPNRRFVAPDGTELSNLEAAQSLVLGVPPHVLMSGPEKPPAVAMISEQVMGTVVEGGASQQLHADEEFARHLAAEEDQEQTVGPSQMEVDEALARQLATEDQQQQRQQQPSQPTHVPLATLSAAAPEFVPSTQNASTQDGDVVEAMTPAQTAMVGPITVPLVSMAGVTLASVSLNTDDLAARLHFAAAKALGGRPCRLVLSSGEELEESSPVAKAGLQHGMSVTVVAQMGVEEIYSTKRAFAALKSDGSVVAWGDDEAGGNAGGQLHLLYQNVERLKANDFAFAALLTNGSVVAWGHHVNGGQVNPQAATQLHNGVTQLFASQRAFAALKSNGAVVTWGDSAYGGQVDRGTQPELNGGVTEVFSTCGAFAALKSSGSVFTWGRLDYGGDSRDVTEQLRSGVKTISATRDAFAAVKVDGSVVAWGEQGGDMGSVAALLQDGVARIVANHYAFAALMMDGAVVTWGNRDWGGDSRKVASLLNGTMPVVEIFCTDNAFAALRMDSSVVTWGEPMNGGSSSAVSLQLVGNIETIFSTQSAFAALTTNGALVVWGDKNHGGEVPFEAGQLQSGVEQVASTRHAFAAVKSGGVVVVWGHPEWGGEIPLAKTICLSSGVERVIAADRAFAARKVDGSVITWGDFGAGGDSDHVAEQLGVKEYKFH